MDSKLDFAKQHWIKKISWVALFSLFLSVWWVIMAQATTGWIGTIKYTEEFRMDYLYSTDDPYNIRASCLYNILVNIEVNACCQDGRLVDAKVSANYEEVHRERCQWSQNHQICCGGVPIFAASSADRKKGCQRIAPGNRGDVSFGWSGVKMGDPEIEDISLVVGEDGWYILNVDVSLTIYRRYTSSGATYFVCSGERKEEPLPFPVVIDVRNFGFYAEGNVGDDGLIEDERTFYQTDEAQPGPGCFSLSCGRDGPTLPGDEDAERKDYFRKAGANWKFKEACFGVITQCKGDVRITSLDIGGELPESGVENENWPVQLGCVEASPGTIVKTGAKSRFEISSPDGVVIRLGSNSEVELAKLCLNDSDVPPIKLITGKIIEFLVFLTEDTEFKPIVINTASGVRGQVPERGKTHFARSLIKKFVGSVWAADQNEWDLSVADLNEAELAVQVERLPGLCKVKSLKGTFIIHYQGTTMHLDSGQEYTCHWKVPLDPSLYTEILITVDEQLPQSFEEAPTIEEIPTSDPCEYLKFIRSQLQQTLEQYEVMIEESPSLQQQHETLKYQIEQLDHAIKQQCP